jgi:hypothetical protein
VPVLFVPGNHEFDNRDVDQAAIELRAFCDELGLRMLHRDTAILVDDHGRRIRFCGTVRWSDFDLFGPARRERALRAGGYFMRVMQARRDGAPFDAQAVREEALGCRDWLAAQLRRQPQDDAEPWDETIVITHFAPSVRSADPRFGLQPSTASFCNADDDLLPQARLWLHGHLHCRHDYTVAHAGGVTRVVSNARGHASKGEAEGWRGDLLIEV